MPPNDLVLTKANLLGTRGQLRKFFIDSTFSSLAKGNKTIGPSAFHFDPDDPETISVTKSVMEQNPQNAWHSIFVDTFGMSIGKTLDLPGQTPFSSFGILDPTSILPTTRLSLPKSKDEVERWIVSEILLHIKSEEELKVLGLPLDTSNIPSPEVYKEKIEEKKDEALGWVAEQLLNLLMGASAGLIPVIPEIPSLSFLDLPGYEEFKKYSEQIIAIVSQMPTNPDELRSFLERKALELAEKDLPTIPPIPQTPEIPGIPPIPPIPQIPIPGIPPIPGIVLPSIVLEFLALPLSIIQNILGDVSKLQDLAITVLTEIKNFPKIIFDLIFKLIEEIPYINEILSLPEKPKLFVASFLTVVKFLVSAIGVLIVGSLIGAGSISSSIPNLVSELF